MRAIEFTNLGGAPAFDVQLSFPSAEHPPYDEGIRVNPPYTRVEKDETIRKATDSHFQAHVVWIHWRDRPGKKIRKQLWHTINNERIVMTRRQRLGALIAGTPRVPK